MKTRLLVALALGAVWAAVSTPSNGATRVEAKQADRKAKSVLDFTVKDMDGKDVALQKYKGDVLLVVNVASK